MEIVSSVEKVDYQFDYTCFYGLPYEYNILNIVYGANGFAKKNCTNIFIIFVKKQIRSVTKFIMS